MLIREASLKQRIPCIIRISIFGAFSAGKKCALYMGKYGSVVSDPGCVAKVFSDYFANTIQLEHRSDTDYTDHPSIKAISNLRFSSEFNYSPVSTSYIRNILDHLNLRKAVGVDGISPRILHLGSPVLAEKVANVINFWIYENSPLLHCIAKDDRRLEEQY